MLYYKFGLLVRLLTLLSAFQTVFLLMACVIQPQYEDFCLFVVSCFVLFCYLLLEACTLLKRKWRERLLGRAERGGRKLGGKGKYAWDVFHVKCVWFQFKRRKILLRNVFSDFIWFRKLDQCFKIFYETILKTKRIAILN